MTLIINKLELTLSPVTAKTAKKKARMFEEQSGFYSVGTPNIKGEICQTKFIFNNYIYIRFGDTKRIIDKDYFSYSVYPYNCEFVDDEINYIESCIDEPEYLQLSI